MTDEDRSPLLTSNARTVLLVVSILVMLVVALLLIRSRHPRAIASIQPPTSVPAHRPPAIPHHANTAPPKLITPERWRSAVTAGCRSTKAMISGDTLARSRRGPQRV